MSNHPSAAASTLRQRNLSGKSKVFTDASPAIFSPSNPELATIVEESSEDCFFPDDPSQIAVEISSEVFTRPGKPVRGGGDKLRMAAKTAVGMVTPTFAFLVMACFSWFKTVAG
eukprot:1838534-Rhodomonas_salina.1